jgi:tRNA nucleotidyltransferase/poly(A) polymerase
VRFVGDPADRIREDYLRILRLFRFAALYGREPIDDATLAACAAHKGGLGKLSGERLQAEMAKLLAAPDPITALAQMRDCGVLAEILPLRDDGRMLRRLIAAEGAASVPDRPWLRRCAALIAPAALEVLAGRLKFSNADHAHLAALLADSPRLNPRATAVEIDRALFTMGVAIVRERVLLEWAAQPALEEPIRRGEWRAFLERLAVWQHRPLPVGGDDILALDILPGPSVGKLIDEMTAWWIETGFTSSRDQALIELRRRVSAFQNR